MSGATSTPEAVIGMDLQGKGFQEVYSQLEKHMSAWDHIAASAGKMTEYLGRASGHISALAGVAGIGAIVADFTRVEDVTARIALNVGYIRGDGSGHRGITSGIFQAGRNTSLDPTALGGALASASSMLPSNGVLNGAGPTTSYGTQLGILAQAYGVNVGTMTSQASQAALVTGQGMGALPGMLGQLANQAAKSGMAGQTGLYWQSVLGVTAGLGSQHPFAANGNPGLSGQLGALYGAAAHANQAFRDPGTFAAGVAGIDQGVSQAYMNPRMETAMQMAGINYWDQRAGLAGKHGAATARKLLSFADRQYGHGSIQEDLFLRSQFGDVSADLLRAYSKGHITYGQLTHTGAAGAQGIAHNRYTEPYHTPGALAQRNRNAAGHAATGPLGAILNGLSHLSPAEAIALGIGGPRALGMAGRGAGAILRKVGNAGRALFAQGGADAAAAGEAGGAGIFGDLLGAAGGVLGGAAGAYAGAMIFPDSAGLSPKAEHALLSSNGAGWLQGLLSHTRSEAQHRFGKNFMADPRAQQWMLNRLHHPRSSKYSVGGADEQALIGAGSDLMQGLFGVAGTKDAKKASDRFDAATKRFEKSIERITNPGARNTGASYMGGGGTLNMAGMAGASDGIGANMILARYITAAASGGGAGGTAGTQFADMVTPAGGGGGGGGGDTGGGGWQSCTLTWYDPALGGTNSSSGRKDPHSAMANGKPYEASNMTCAAPSSYAFGTKISFAYNGNSVTCTVTDRGGAINGSHFDLSRGAAQALGMIQAGSVAAKFKVLGSSAQSAKKGHHGHGHGGGGGGGAQGAMPARTQAAIFHPPRSGGAGGPGGGGDVINVHIDGRKLETYRRLTRGRA